MWHLTRFAQPASSGAAPTKSAVWAAASSQAIS